MTNYEYHVTVVATDDEGYSTFPQVFVYGSLTEFLMAAEALADFYDSSYDELSIDIVKVPVEELADWELDLLSGQFPEPEADAYDLEPGWSYWDLEPEPTANTTTGHPLDYLVALRAEFSPKPKSRSFFAKVFGRK